MRQKVKIQLTILILSFSALFLVNNVSAQKLTPLGYEFTSDDKIISDYGWDFSLTVRANFFEVEGYVMTFNYYPPTDPLQPVNYISHTDILIGTGDVGQDPEFYKLSYKWETRAVLVSFEVNENDVQYVISNLGNIHCIARNQLILDQLYNVQNRSLIRLAGYLVDVYGSNGVNAVEWKTGLFFGDPQCEILVITQFQQGNFTVTEQLEPTTVMADTVFIIIAVTGIGLIFLVGLIIIFRRKK